MTQKYSQQVDGSGVVCWCPANDSQLFTGTALHLETHMHGFLLIPIDYIIDVCLYVPGLCALIFCIYCVLLLTAYLKDDRDQSRVSDANGSSSNSTANFFLQHAPVYLISNRYGEYYSYVIIVLTGAPRGSSTTSHVGIKLYGTFANSKVSDFNLLS